MTENKKAAPTREEFTKALALLVGSIDPEAFPEATDHEILCHDYADHLESENAELRRELQDMEIKLCEAQSDIIERSMEKLGVTRERVAESEALLERAAALRAEAGEDAQRTQAAVLTVEEIDS